MSSGCCTERSDIWLSWEEQDGEDTAILNFSDEAIDALGWQEGDELDFVVEDGCIVIRKVAE